MIDHDDTDALLTDDQARDELGSEAFTEALESGELRRVTHDGSSFILRDDVQRIRDDSDPRKLAFRVPRL